MRYRIEMNLNYVQLKKGDNLYDNVDLEVEDCVEARYWKENGYPGNPDVSYRITCNNGNQRPLINP